tara:strand:- start:815 stop:1588 length:774 start_codon:yes stop_codon:yes gene_type:complete
MAQTTIQKSNAIRKGSVRIEIGDDSSSLVDIGAIRNPVFTSLVENQNIEFDNVNDLKKFVEGDKVQFSFDLAEINLTNLAELDAGMVTLTTTAASPVSGATQNVASGAWSYNTFIAIANQNGDGTVPTINSVTLGTDGAIVAETDYVTVKQGGTWGIVIWDSTTVTTEAQTIVIDYDYTPAASKKLTFTSQGTKTEKYVRITNTDENGNEFRIDFNQATNFSSPSIDFAADDEEDVAILPVSLEGYLVEIVDEQQTT